MKKQKVDLFDKVEVTWYDALSAGNKPWKKLKKYLRQNKKSVIPQMTQKTIGYIVENKKKYIDLTMTRGIGDHKDVIGTTFTIPKGCIKKIKRFK